MKLVLVNLIIAVALTTAVEDPSDQLVKICGEEMLKALQQACEQKNFDYLLKHGQYDPYRDYPRDHKHHHGENPSHDHNHGHDHSHSHTHGHHNHDNHSHAEKKENDRSIAEECCNKPCHIKDFIRFCG